MGLGLNVEYLIIPGFNWQILTSTTISAFHLKINNPMMSNQYFFTVILMEFTYAPLKYFTSDL